MCRMDRGVLGAPGRNRTCGQQIRNLLLYPLSYEGASLKGEIKYHKIASLKIESTWLFDPLFKIKRLAGVNGAARSEFVDAQQLIEGHIVF